MRTKLLSSLMLCVFALALPQAFADDKECIDKSTTIDEKLGCLKQITFKDVTSQTTPAGYRQFEIGFTQPTDHADPTAGTFSQRLVLLHLDEAEPMVLQTSGYVIFSVRKALLTTLFKTNQIQVEHRFFANSKPSPVDWSKLDIKQSADDFHAITAAFRQIYGKKWVNTGGSKGGMTSIYHRRFYPDDLDGTVADVAPQSFSNSDQRYSQFISKVGGDTYATCRDNFHKLQIELLKNRDLIVPNIRDEFGTFNRLGSIDLAFEHLVIESQFYFWQYLSPTHPAYGCDKIPTEGTIEQMMAYLDGMATLGDYNDDALDTFGPYYYQAATQLGSPDNLTYFLEKFRRFDFHINQYVPEGAAIRYSRNAMLDVDQWVRTEADRLILVYGEFDPWSAGEFPVSETGKAVFKYYAPKANHGSRIDLLTASDKAKALESLTAWFGKSPVAPPSSMKTSELLENAEMKARRKFKIP